LKDWLRVTATLEMSLRSQISSVPVLFIHLVIVDYDATGGAFDLAYNYLGPYFPSGGLTRCQVNFDFATAAKMSSYHSTVMKIVRDLRVQRRWSRVVVGISNHTDDTLGDPFIGYQGNSLTKYIGARTDQVGDSRRMLVIVLMKV
jgi:hypothetical protein